MGLNGASFTEFSEKMAVVRQTCKRLEVVVKYIMKGIE
jgi:hypothetical protein